MKKDTPTPWATVGIFSLIMVVGCQSEPTLDEAASLFVEAKQALADGNKEQALELLTMSISSRPDEWAYYERAKLYAENGQDEDARADIAAGLEINPNHSDLLWLQKEMSRSSKSRFKGRTAKPPGASK